MASNKISPTWVKEVRENFWGSAGNATFLDDPDGQTSSPASVATLFEKHADAGISQSYKISETTNLIGITYSVPVVTSNWDGFTDNPLYWGGVLDRNGDIHYVPHSANIGIRVNRGAKSTTTYSLIHTTTGAYIGGVLSQDGTVYFIPHKTNTVQTVKGTTVSTFSLATTVSNTGRYYGGCLDKNGFIHLVPYDIVSPNLGQFINPTTKTCHTYNLLNAFGYRGGVLGPDGYVHFITAGSIGQKVLTDGVNTTVSTYSLITVAGTGYTGGVLGADGCIHFVPVTGLIGKKVDATKNPPVVSTYNLPSSGSGTQDFWSATLSPSGSIYFLDVSTQGITAREYTANGQTSVARVTNTPTYQLGGSFNFSFYGTVLDFDNFVHLTTGYHSFGVKFFVGSHLGFTNGSILSSHFNNCVTGNV